MAKAAMAAVVALCALALGVVAAQAQSPQGGRAFGAPPAQPSAQPPAQQPPAQGRGGRPAADAPPAPGGSTAAGRSISVPEAEAQLREAEQQPGPPGRRLIRPLIVVSWAYYRAGREQDAIASMRRVVELLDAAREPNRAVLGRALTDLGFFLQQNGRPGEAAQALERALPIVESEESLQRNSYVAGAAYTTLGQIRVIQGRTREGQALIVRGIAAREAHLRTLQAEGAPPSEIAIAYSRLARSYSNAGRVQEAVDSATQAVAFAERSGVAVDLAQSLNDLGFTLRTAGRNAEAEAALVRALQAAERGTGAASPAYARALTTLGRVQSDAGKLREADETLRRALALQQRISGEGSLEVAQVQAALGQVAQNRRNYQEAEQRLQAAIATMQRRFGPNHPNLAAPLTNLARTYRLENRLSEAEQMLQRAIGISERGYGADHVWTNQFRTELVRVMISQGRYAEALPLVTRTAAGLERTANNSRAQGMALLNQSMVYRGLGRLPEAEATGRRALTVIQAAVTPTSPALADTTMLLGRTLLAQGKQDDAATLFRTAVDIYERGMGPTYPDLAWARDGLSSSLLAKNDLGGALAAIRDATAVLRLRSQAASAGREQEETGERLSFRQVFVDHVRVAYAVQAAQPAMPAELTAEAFAMAQQAQEGGTAAALARMADRFAAGDDALAQRLRERSDLLERTAAVNRQLSEVLGAQGGAPAVARLRAELDASRRTLAELDRRIAREFPSYRRLISSEGVTLGEIQRALGDDEALLNYIVGQRETYLFVVRRERAAFLRLEIDSGQLTQDVRVLRQGVNPDGVSSIETLPRFDLARAHRLYLAILAPAMEALAGVGHVFVVPDRALQSLPFNLLVASPPPGDAQGFDAYRQAEWLVRRMATSTLPSASALRALRELARPSRASDPFIGFGDPTLIGPPGGSRSINAARLFLRSGQPNLRAIRELSPLPETADELRALARMFGAGDGALFLRDQATVRRVRATPLQNYRVVAFATHGLTAGELSDVAEPGLILTPPETASVEDDGILTASAIAALRLDADWVVLSACNTAAADGSPGAEALSGLARAFFYAGSRALLVSHWAVASQAAQQLTTGTFAALAREPTIGRAEGLRRSMLAMIDSDTTYMAHPLFWAPFVVVGEGGRAISVPIEPPAE
jgi:CHAT domain-containing protein